MMSENSWSIWVVWETATFAAAQLYLWHRGFCCQFETAEINKPLPMSTVSCLRQLWFIRKMYNMLRTCAEAFHTADEHCFSRDLPLLSIFTTWTALKIPSSCLSWLNCTYQQFHCGQKCLDLANITHPLISLTLTVATSPCSSKFSVCSSFLATVISTLVDDTASVFLALVVCISSI